MRTINSTLGAILGSRRLMRTTVAFGLLLVLGFAQNGFAQTPIPLGLSNNYMVTGDYVVGGVEHRLLRAVFATVPGFAGIMTVSAANGWTICR